VLDQAEERLHFGKEEEEEVVPDLGLGLKLMGT
jgi:hypothetical protein